MNILACNLCYSTFDYSSLSGSGYITQFPLCKRPSVKSNSLRRPSILIVDADIVYVNGNDVVDDEQNAYFVFSLSLIHIDCDQVASLSLLKLIYDRHWVKAIK